MYVVKGVAHNVYSGEVAGACMGKRMDRPPCSVCGYRADSPSSRDSCRVGWLWSGCSRVDRVGVAISVSSCCVNRAAVDRLGKVEVKGLGGTVRRELEPERDRSRCGYISRRHLFDCPKNPPLSPGLELEACRGVGACQGGGEFKGSARCRLCCAWPRPLGTQN